MEQSRVVSPWSWGLAWVKNVLMPGCKGKQAFVMTFEQFLNQDLTDQLIKWWDLYFFSSKKKGVAALKEPTDTFFGQFVMSVTNLSEILCL